MHHRLWERRRFMGLIGITTLLILLISQWVTPGSLGQSAGTNPTSPAPTTNYDLAWAAPFNRFDTYPIKPLPSTAAYRPTGEWVGRLILPSQEEYRSNPGDWVWMEVWHAPMADPNLVGQKVKLTWQPGPASEAYVQAVSRDVQFTERAKKSVEAGNILPTRLNGRKAVGPLQSLAGARPKDAMTVRLSAAKLMLEGETPVIETPFEPVQVTGREYALVKLLEPDTSVKQPLPKVCPGPVPCPTEYFQVQHYNAMTGDFDGEVETVRIPQQPKLQGDRFFSTIRNLAEAPAGAEGWYVYGARDKNDVFTVQALKPRALFQITPDEVILGETAGLNYISRQNWENTPPRKGRLQRVLVSPDATDPDMAVNTWQEGDAALVIHLFGGIGGENSELTPAGTVTGHFSFGLGRVIREPFTRELQFDILYEQIYAHNSSSIISGTQDWSAYAGDMQKGWIGQRPFSDVVIKLDDFIDTITLNDVSLSLFQELLIQAQVIAARYRIGDGTGVAMVTPSTSCVQDSSQALYVAMEQIKHQATQDPALADWVKQHPEDPEVQQLQRFIILARELVKALTPYGTVRADWENNAASLAGVDARGGFVSDSGLINGILSWRSMMPRWGHDDFSRIFLRNGAQLWFLRPNQLGGEDPSIEPIAPTLLFGEIPVLGTLAKRLAIAVAAPSWTGGGGVLMGLLVYGAIALPYGFRSGFLRPYNAIANPVQGVLIVIKILFLPALLEEVFFRVFLLPHPMEGVPLGQWWAWAMLSLGLFVLYHLLSAATVYPTAKKTFSDKRFLILMTWLGLVLTVAYRITGSLWVITAIHWVVVVLWLLGLGGLPRLSGQFPTQRPRPTPIQERP